MSFELNLGDFQKLLLEMTKKMKINHEKNNNFKRWQEVLILASAGLVIGFINGFLGAGGGILLVPVLTGIIKEPVKVAHSTAVIVILPLCIASGIVYILKGFYNFNIGWKILIGTIIGGILGTFLLKKLANNWLSLIFAIVMIAAGIYMCVR